MTKEEMLSAIYDEMADKTLSDGCIIERFLDRYLIWSKILEILPDNELIHYWDVRWQEYWNNMQYEIIWHPVRIGNVLKYIDSNCCLKELSSDWLRERDIKALNHMLHSVFYNFVGKQDRPIEEQDEQCIEFVYSLIKK